MKNFNFRLARVLRVRRIEEHVARAAFLEQQAKAREAQESFSQALVERRQMEVQLADQVRSGPLDPRSAIRGQDSIDSMSRVCLRRRETATTLTLQAEQARQPWSEARIEVRALEHLEETKRARFRSETEKQANLELDETAARRAKRRTQAR
ncbi:MAG: flagellar export protein FliJ [Chlamydiales bacterium]|jgi:flagellar export protein FliJ